MSELEIMQKAEGRKQQADFEIEAEATWRWNTFGADSDWHKNLNTKKPIEFYIEQVKAEQKP